MRQEIALRRPKIWAFGISKLMGLFQDIAPRYAARADIRLIDKGYAEAADLLDRAAAADVDIVVAAGSNGAYLRSRTSLPVVLVNVTGFDVMSVVARARREHQHVALVTYGTTLADFERMKAAFGMDIEHLSYRDAADAEQRVRELRQRGFTAIAGPGLVSALAEDAGLAGYFLYSHASVAAVFDTALEIALANRIEGARRERLDAVLKHIHDGVLATDAYGRIESVNPALAAILGLEAEHLVGRRLADVVPGFTVDADPGVRQQRVQAIGATVYAVDAAPIVEHGVRTGTVMTFQESQAVQRLDRSLRARRRSSQHTAKFELSDLIGASAPLQALRTLAARYARHDATILLSGESGTGKEVIAQGIHNAGPRRAFPFVAINCGAFPETLLESELFGYEEGAFTGARRGGKPGLIEAAHGGTLFLDEIGEMPLLLQPRLLRVLQEREVLRLGGGEPIPVDIRVIAATNRHLEDRIADGGFRADLFFRLNILRLEVPPLRERGGDIALLAQTLLEGARRRMNATFDVMAALRPLLASLNAHTWPGNVRELENIVERLAIHWSDRMAEPDAQPLSSIDALVLALPPSLVASGSGAGSAAQPSNAAGPQQVPLAPASTAALPPADGLRQARRSVEHSAAARMVAACGGDRDEACRRLGISRSTLWRKLKALG